MSTLVKLIVTAEKLNKRSVVPSQLPEKNHITGVVFKGFEFLAEEVLKVPNKDLGTWYKDRDGNFYWGGGVKVFETIAVQEPEEEQDAHRELENFNITPAIKRKIEQVINAFETGSALGNYGELVKLKDYQDPQTKTFEVQITFGRSQTTEFGHLKTLVKDYVETGGQYAGVLQPYLSRIGQKPSLASDAVFCDTLKKAGKSDDIMKHCQDRLFDLKYYQPAHNWFHNQGFTLPLSLLVIYDSYIHSGCILSFLRKRFSTVVPANGGNEKEWIGNYINVRRNWLATHSNPLLKKTTYRMDCFLDAIAQDNWSLAGKINANGVIIN